MSFMLLGILNAQAAGGGGSAYDLLETQTLASSAASVTFTGLGSYSDYKHLQIRGMAKNNYLSDGGLTNFKVNLNGDTTNSYGAHYLEGDGSSVSSSTYLSAYEMTLGRLSSRTSPSRFVPIVMDILDFSSSSKNTTIRCFKGFPLYPGQTTAQIGLYSGLHRSTSAVTSITLGSAGTDFASQTSFSIYGIKG